MWPRWSKRRFDHRNLPDQRRRTTAASLCKIAAMILIFVPAVRTTTTATPPGSSGELTCGSTFTDDTTGADHIVGSPSGEHHYSLRVPSTRQYTFSTCTGSSYDTLLRLYSGSHLDGEGEEISSVDDACGGLQSQLVINLNPGLYTLVVEGYDNREGTYRLATSCRAAVCCRRLLVQAARNANAVSNGQQVSCTTSLIQYQGERGGTGIYAQIPGATERDRPVYREEDTSNNGAILSPDWHIHHDGTGWAIDDNANPTNPDNANNTLSALNSRTPA